MVRWSRRKDLTGNDFEAVHDRRLLEPPVVDCPAPFVRRNRWHAEIIGRSLRDRVLRTLVGKTVTLTIQNWGGAMYVVKAEFPRVCSRFIVSYRPLENKRTHFDVIVFAPRGLSALTLAVRHCRTAIPLMYRTRYRAPNIVPHDLFPRMRTWLNSSSGLQHCRSNLPWQRRKIILGTV